MQALISQLWGKLKIFTLQNLGTYLDLIHHITDNTTIFVVDNKTFQSPMCFQILNVMQGSNPQTLCVVLLRYILD